jgi:patatin-like phospholipase/acyl hydrolase
MSVLDKKAKPGPRKLLALDGGGIRGVMTLEVLAKIESDVQTKLGRGDDFVLADYFDYVAGTSTGAIIATCLSLGMRVDEIRKFYLDSGPAMFDKASLLRRFRNKFDDQKLKQKLQDIIKERTGEDLATLGSDAIRTYLMLVLRNATTDSPWPISNNPEAKYNLRTHQQCNLALPLWQLVRASTAAPTYFPPEVVNIGAELEYIFVDGGVTMYNNPAFQLFLMATVGQYKLGWPTGEDKMLLISIGTGVAANANKDLQPGEMNLIYNASSLPAAFMFAAANEQDLLCRVFGKCLNGSQLDRELWDLMGDKGQGPVTPKLFTYMRYNADVSREGLDALGLTQIEPEQVQKMDSVEFIPQLREVGRAIARQVNIDHFAGFLQSS